MRSIAACWFLLAAALPALAWHGVALKLASQFRFHLGYLLSAWSGFALMALGLICFVPVLLSVGSEPEGRLYPQRRAAFVAWGASLYLLGLALSVQVAQMSRIV
jgi:hypothetical protein